MFKYLFVIVGSIASATAFAQSEKFSGASIGINTGFESSKSTFTTNLGSFSPGSNNTAFNVDANYIFALSSAATLGLGTTFDLTSSKLLKASENSLLQSTDISLKNHYSAYVAPGYAFSDSALGYFKLAYQAGKASGTTTSKNINGVGYGFGAIYSIDKNLFLNLEIQQVEYKSVTVNTTSIAVSETLSTIGIGYKF